MQKISTSGFENKVYLIVKNIPYGKVATYGQLALLAGRPECSRLAGRAMHFVPPEHDSHRVVNSAGRLVPGWKAQRGLLEAEGVCFKANGNVNMKKHRWYP